MYIIIFIYKYYNYEYLEVTNLDIMQNVHMFQAWMFKR